MNPLPHEPPTTLQHWSSAIASVLLLLCNITSFVVCFFPHTIDVVLCSMLIVWCLVLADVNRVALLAGKPHCKHSSLYSGSALGLRGNAGFLLCIISIAAQPIVSPSP